MSICMHDVMNEEVNVQMFVVWKYTIGTWVSQEVMFSFLVVRLVASVFTHNSTFLSFIPWVAGEERNLDVFC